MSLLHSTEAHLKLFLPNFSHLHLNSNRSAHFFLLNPYTGRRDPCAIDSSLLSSGLTSLDPLIPLKSLPYKVKENLTSYKSIWWIWGAIEAIWRSSIVFPGFSKARPTSFPHLRRWHDSPSTGEKRVSTRKKEASWRRKKRIKIFWLHWPL